MATYTDLNARPASAFLNASAFLTDYDADRTCKGSRYHAALAELKGYKAFVIGAGGVWCADCIGGAFVSSYEGIGYHAKSAELLQAALDSDCAFFIYRYEGDKIAKFDVRAMQAGRDGRIG